MKELDYIEGMIKHLLKRDVHLALNNVQVKQLVKYIREYEDKIGMLPPRRVPKFTKYGELNNIGEHTFEDDLD